MKWPFDRVYLDTNLMKKIEEYNQSPIDTLITFSPLRIDTHNLSHNYYSAECKIVRKQTVEDKKDKKSLQI